MLGSQAGIAILASFIRLNADMRFAPSPPSIALWSKLPVLQASTSSAAPREHVHAVDLQALDAEALAAA